MTLLCTADAGTFAQSLADEYQAGGWHSSELRGYFPGGLRVVGCVMLCGDCADEVSGVLQQSMDTDGSKGISKVCAD